jgi:hypothetical protein
MVKTISPQPMIPNQEFERWWRTTGVLTEPIASMNSTDTFVAKQAAQVTWEVLVGEVSDLRKKIDSIYCQIDEVRTLLEEF